MKVAFSSMWLMGRLDAIFENKFLAYIKNMYVKKFLYINIWRRLTRKPFSTKLNVPHHSTTIDSLFMSVYCFSVHYMQYCDITKFNVEWDEVDGFTRYLIIIYCLNFFIIMWRKLVKFSFCKFSPILLNQQNNLKKFIKFNIYPPNDSELFIWLRKSTALKAYKLLKNGG